MSASLFPIGPAQLVGIICEGILYGSYLVTCWLCARTLLFKVDNQKLRLVRLHEIRWLLTIVSITFFIITTWDMAIWMLYIVNAITKAEGLKAKVNGAWNWINIALLVNEALAVLLGDFVLIYRCWIIYDRRWRVIALSVILYLGVIAMAIIAMVIEAASWASVFFTPDLCPWVATMFGIHAVQNILTSGLLVWPIWRVGRLIDQNTDYPGGHEATPPRPLQRLKRAIIESGAVYTTTVFATFLASASRSKAVYIAADMSLQTAGIASNVIITRRTDQSPQYSSARCKVHQSSKSVLAL